MCGRTTKSFRKVTVAESLYAASCIYHTSEVLRSAADRHRRAQCQHVVLSLLLLLLLVVVVVVVV